MTKRLTPLQKIKKETSRLNSIANKRIKRLEKSGIYSPSLEKWKENGSVKFSVKNKDYNETQKELARVRNFLNAKTSSITGSKKLMKEISDSTGLELETNDDFVTKSRDFFELSSKVEQYLRLTDGSASAIGYQRIWQAINQYTTDTETPLKKVSVNDIVERLDGLIKEQQATNFLDFMTDDYIDL